MTVVYVMIAALLVAAVCFGIRYFVRASQRFGGERVIICPETGKQAMVEVDVRHAAISSLVGQTDLRLENCWRWPMKQGCGQECLLQLDVADANCLVRSVLEKWYRDKACAFCAKPFDDINLTDHKPALLNPEGATVEWQQIPISAVTEAMATYLPVCWNCHIAQAFRREHPELVVDRTLPLIDRSHETHTYH
ncbi:MAG TPA: hypothetical protein VE863_01405 [Pyrinomonadaceae bacterium]|jgi:hypothetical protein|nr:hypothetical protein [Pyrinomonadaceae bacterium]